MQDICRRFHVTNQEYELLSDKFQRLVKDIGWKLIRKNSRNNHTDDVEDIFQDVEIAMLRACSYYKRQVYIETCLELCKTFSKSYMFDCMLKELSNLWDKKTRHGANKQKFGPYQEKLLDKLVRKLVPPRSRPSKNRPLRFDEKFVTYCKSVMWNEQRAKGKKITREKPLRSGLVSLCDFDYLGGMM